MIYYDVSDLVNHARFSTRVSGIQRVVLEGSKRLKSDHRLFFFSPYTKKAYLLEGIDSINLMDLSCFRGLWMQADLIKMPNPEHYFIYADKYAAKKGRFALFAKIFMVVVKFPVLGSLLIRMLQPVLKRRVPAEASTCIIKEMPNILPDDKFAILGGVWNFQDCYEDLILKLPNSVRKIFLIYDLIPIVSPYSPLELKQLFLKFIPFAIKSASLIIVNSHSCKDDLEKFSKENNFELPTIKVVHLTHELPKITNDSSEIPLRTKKLRPEKFILCVGSIESRKNHLNLLIMWAKFFHSEHYANQKLVIAGRWLWDTGQVQQMLAATGNVYGSVVIIEDPSDKELQELYMNCHFTVYPSHYEGWGLPIGESLRYYKPCLHFDTSSLKEAGYGLTTVVGYPDYKAYIENMIKLFNDKIFYDEVVADIVKGSSRLRSWNDFSSDLNDIMSSC